MNTKRNIFYVLVFLTFFLFTRAAVYFAEITSVKVDIFLILGAVLFVGMMMMMEKLLMNKVKSKDNFDFELTPEKHCDGGSYMWSSDPEKKKFCSQFSKEQLAEYDCPAGFHGRPVHWERTNMSDDKWQNKMCDNGFDYNYPKPL